MITTAHHAITDGLSSIQLHSEILTYCQKITAGESIQAFTILEALPPIENLLPTWTNSFKSKLNRITLLLNIIFQKYWNCPKTLVVEKYVHISQLDPKLFTDNLAKKSTQQFMQKCKQENTTIQSALCAALMLTALSTFEKK